MKIVEYNHSYAQKVAEMWNKSGPNWGNEEIFKTAQDVIDTESSSGNLKLYIAIDEDQVVGYCSLSEYQHDEGASYLPLLNVIPEYHGKKVGKQLILKVLNDAKETVWSRFDLYTWSGNIKAMPLYKKCGFFWERKNDSVHLMNFVPYLNQTEALNDYLKLIDTYNDNKRHIDMNQDGITRNGFEFYRYEFINKDIELFCEFEKQGRGLTYLDTPDYKVRMNISSNEQVYNNNYEVSFDVINKTKEPLNIKIEGKNNKNISFSLEKESIVLTNERIIGQYYVGPIEKDQDKSRTHPVIEADIYINGKLATFKTGIEPKHPVTLKLYTEHYNHILDKDYTCYLDLENNLPTKEEFTISLPNSFVTFEENVKVTLEPKEKRSVKVSYCLNDYGFYRETATVSYQDFSIMKTVYAPFKGSRTSFIGKSEYLYYMVSGNYITYVNTKSGNIALKNSQDSSAINSFMQPQLGLPYNLEFSTQIPEIKIVSDNELSAIYTSKAFDGIKIIRHAKHEFGVLEVKYEIVNTKEEQTVSLTIPVWQQISDSFLPYKGKLLYLDVAEEEEFGFLKNELFDENWFFNKKEHFGFCWDNTLDMKIAEWKLAFDLENITLKKGESYMSSSFYTSYVHKDVNDFRKFAGFTEERNQIKYHEVLINEGNPFVKGTTIVEVSNHSKKPLKGELIVGDTKVTLPKTVSCTPGLIEITLAEQHKRTSFKRQTFELNGEISKTTEEDSLVVDNGFLTFKASNDFGDTIYSLQVKGKEYLDSNYPNPKERAWWGDFIGGLTLRTSGFQDISAIKEPRTTEFVTVNDNFGNKWEGIKITVTLEKDPDLKGLVLETYTITQPGIPVLHSFSKIINNTGKFIYNKQFNKFNTIKLSDNREDVFVVKGDSDYICNGLGIELEVDKLAYYKTPREYNLAIYNHENTLIPESQKEYNMLFSEKEKTIPDLESRILLGDYFVFTKEVLKKEYLEDLKNIKFEV